MKSEGGGGDSPLNDTRKTLANAIEDAEWPELEPHLRRDALIVVDRDIPLFEAGVRIAEDQKQQVSEWIRQGRLRKPTIQEIEAWSKNPQATFRCLIVQPYVLVQPVVLQ